MSITFQVLGAAGRDNALLVQVNQGQRLHRLLCDCGAVGLDELPAAEVHALDHLLLSHLHMDHIGGFDTLFRRLFNRAEPPNQVWGPPETAQILHHRLRGFQWNLHQDLEGVWYVHDIGADRVATWRFAAREAFAFAHAEGERAHTGVIFTHPDYQISAVTLDHMTPSIGYIVREPPRRNIDPDRLAALGLPPGPWVRQVKEPQPDEAPTLTIAGQLHALADLRAALLVATPGDTLAYLTDFRLDAATLAQLVPALQGCTTLICESQYRHADRELAERAYHLTARQSAELARAAGVARLVLFHVSERYQRWELPALLAEAQAIFPNTQFPDHWAIEAV